MVTIPSARASCFIWSCSEPETNLGKTHCYSIFHAQNLPMNNNYEWDPVLLLQFKWAQSQVMVAMKLCRAEQVWVQPGGWNHLIMFGNLIVWKANLEGLLPVFPLHSSSERSVLQNQKWEDQKECELLLPYCKQSVHVCRIVKHVLGVGHLCYRMKMSGAFWKNLSFFLHAIDNIDLECCLIFL